MLSFFISKSLMKLEKQFLIRCSSSVFSLSKFTQISTRNRKLFRVEDFAEMNRMPFTC